MNLKKLALGLALSVCFVAPSFAQNAVLEGDQRSACEVILCLAAGQRPDECTPPIRRYFSISAKKLGDLIKKRKAFLSLCPKGDDPKTAALVNALGDGAGRCDAGTLNNELRRSRVVTDTNGETIFEIYIEDVMPSYCSAMFGNEYMRAPAPRYVGDKFNSGKWVEDADYPAAWKAYQEMLKEQERRRKALEEARRIQMETGG